MTTTTTTEGTTTVNTYTTFVDPELIDTIAARVDKANRRAARYNVPAITMTVGAIRTERDPYSPAVYVTQEVTLTGGTAYDGWTLLATVDLDGDAPYIVRSAPGVDGDPAWAHVADYCDHCHTSNRGRKQVVLVAHTDGRVVQVGSTCVGDYLGRSLHTLTMFTDLVDDIDKVCAGRTPTTWSLDHVLTVTAAVTRLHGFVSKRAADAYNEAAGDYVKQATSVPVTTYMTTTKQTVADQIVPGGITDADRTAAADAIAWVATTDGSSEYLRNLAVIVERGTVTARTLGYAVSIIGAHQRAMTDAAEKAARTADRTPVPVTDKRMTITGVVLGFKTIENEYGTTEKMRVLDDRGFVVYGTVPTAIAGTYVHDEQGARIVDEAEVGDRVRFDARIEASHDDPTFGFYSRPTKAAIV